MSPSRTHDKHTGTLALLSNVLFIRHLLADFFCPKLYHLPDRMAKRFSCRTGIIDNQRYYHGKHRSLERL